MRGGIWSVTRSTLTSISSVFLSVSLTPSSLTLLTPQPVKDKITLSSRRLLASLLGAATAAPAAAQYTLSATPDGAAGEPDLGFVSFSFKLGFFTDFAGKFRHTPLSITTATPRVTYNAGNNSHPNTVSKILSRISASSREPRSMSELEGVPRTTRCTIPNSALLSRESTRPATRINPPNSN